VTDLFRSFAKVKSGSVAVLASGGVDSSILLAVESSRRRKVFPVFIRAGFRFEVAQRRALSRFLRRLNRRNIQPVTELSVAASEYFPKNHWAFSGRAIPPLESPDGSCYLPGWNLLLLAPTLVFASREGIPSISLGHIAHNPYPDGQPSFFKAFEKLAELAFQMKIRIERPFEKWTKQDVLARGRSLPLELTLTCIDPKGKGHCGNCHKCAERHRGFLKAGIQDRTAYARRIRL
jgi:7-cyano-7-deazaguanine synthase